MYKVSKSLIILISTVVVSCSSNSKKLEVNENIQDKWWSEVEKVGDDIIKFTNDNMLININDKEKLTYSIDGKNIKMKMRDYEKEMELEMELLSKEMDEPFSEESSNSDNSSAEIKKLYIEETWSIASLTDDELVLKKGGKSKTFKLADDQEFFVGKWDGTKKGLEVSFRFTKKNKVEVNANGADEERYSYSFKNNKVIIDDEQFEYSLSEDKNKLTLKGKETINLIRSGR